MRTMDNSMVQNAEAIHYLVSIGILVGEEKGIGSKSNAGFWLLVLEGLIRVRLW